MSEISAAQLARVTSFPKLIELLRDKLDWPIGEDYGFDDIVYEYEADDLGLKENEVAKIREIHQLRPLVTGQPWGIFFISFEDKSISVTVLRRILRALIVKKRAGAQTPDRQTWDLHDLIFVTNFGPSGEREIAFAHFSDAAGDLPVLNVLGWNAKDTMLHNDYVGQVLSDRLRWPDDPTDQKTWRETWSKAFELRLGQVARTSQDLARQLAGLASSIRASANQLLSAETDNGPMRQLLNSFRKNLIQDLDEDGFADMFAQTISYGMLAARISRPMGIVADNLADMIPRTNPFLKELFASFLKIGGRDDRRAMDFDELGVRNVVEMLNAANMEAVLRDFGDRNPKEDPVIHFYELFLKEYDPKKRTQRGVFYTPRPVVNFIARGVDEILRTEFGLPLGLADTSTWAEVGALNDRITIPAHVNPDAPFVQILDPATGTGTFLVEVIELIHKRMEEHWKGQGKSAAEIKAAWNAYVPAHLLPRLTAFELMMAPYTIAHMKVGLKLSETGYTFGSEERARIFLTNALEPASDLDMAFSFMSDALAHEAQAANVAKAKTPFTVVVGNPPYAGISKNMFPWIDGLLKGKEPELPLRKSYYELDGVPLGEKKIWLQDDYVKFIRLAQYFLDRTGSGVLGLISNNGYFDNPTFRGMRWQLLKSFQDISLIDLHGSTQKKETTPEGGSDQNLFEIEQGVGIGIFVRGAEKQQVRIHHLYGTREHKADHLLSRTIRSSSYLDIFPISPFYFFHDRDDANGAEYRSAAPLHEIMSVNVTGIVTARDDVSIGFSEDEIGKVIDDFKDISISDAEIRNKYWPGKSEDKYEAGDSRGWKLPAARIKLRKMQMPTSRIQEFAYRPFDRRKIFYDPTLVDWGRWELMPHIIGGNNVGLAFVRQIAEKTYNHVSVVDAPIDNRYTRSNRGIAQLAPLWLLPINGEPHRRPNIDRAWALGFGKTLGLAYEDGIPRGEQKSFGPAFQSPKAEQLGLLDAPWDGRGDLDKTFGPRDLFDYIYAVLHSQGYRNRYAEFLKSDFPRIPTPEARPTFAALVALGRKLVGLHLLRTEDAPILKAPDIRFAGNGDARVDKGYPAYKNGKVMINATRWFEDVPRDTWEFHVGGYQVCEKWLKDRAGKGGKSPSPGRALADEDILHYRRIVTALTETRRLMEEVDCAIDEHGGWPGAFDVPPPPPPSVEEIIKADESLELEFKATFQWDVKEGKQNKELQKSVLKTLAAFMNTEGGTLVIGVTDAKEIHGLADDLTLTRNSLDVFEQNLLSVFSNTIGAAYAQHISIRFADASDGKKVCVVVAAPSPEPVFLEFQGKQEFYVRRGNSSVALSPGDQHTYVRQRFKAN